jgi:hypothetical protein
VPQTPINRRRFERFCLPHMYTGIAVRMLDQPAFDNSGESGLTGHTYDLSEGGVQFELDRALEPGTAVALRIDLPDAVTQGWDGMGPGRAVFIFANVIWMDDSEPGPVRMAAVFTRFARLGDRDRLIRAFASGVLARAA